VDENSFDLKYKVRVNDSSKVSNQLKDCSVFKDKQFKVSFDPIKVSNGDEIILMCSISRTGEWTVTTYAVSSDSPKDEFFIIKHWEKCFGGTTDNGSDTWNG